MWKMWGAKWTKQFNLAMSVSLPPLHALNDLLTIRTQPKWLRWSCNIATQLCLIFLLIWIKNEKQDFLRLYKFQALEKLKFRASNMLGWSVQISFILHCSEDDDWECANILLEKSMLLSQRIRLVCLAYLLENNILVVLVNTGALILIWGSVEWLLTRHQHSCAARILRNFFQFFSSYQFLEA